MIYVIARYVVSYRLRARRECIESKTLEQFNEEFYAWLDEYKAGSDQEAL